MVKGGKMAGIINSITKFFKGIFEKVVKISSNNSSKYNIKGNKKCNINIVENGDINEKK